MRNFKVRSIIKPLGALVAAALMGITGCVTHVESQSSDEPPCHIGKLLLLPVQNGAQLYGEGKIARCPVSGTSFMTGPVPAGAAMFLSGRLKSMLGEKKIAIIALSDEQYKEERTRVMLHMSDRGEKQILAAIGRDVGADSVMTGTLYLFKQRVGSAYAVDSPASVGFELDLIDAKSAHLIWHRVFEETQRALSDNLLNLGQFFKRKGKWLTAQALAVSGLQEVLKSLPTGSGA